MPSHFQKNDKEYFKKTLSKLFKSSLRVIGKKREETSTSTFTRFKFFSSMKKFITFPILSRALSFSIISTPNNPYKFLQIKRFVHLEMNHYNPSLKIRKVLYKLVSIDVSSQLCPFLFFTTMHVSKRIVNSITKALLYFSSRKSRVLYTVSLRITFQLVKGLFVPLLFVQDNATYSFVSTYNIVSN